MVSAIEEEASQTVRDFETINGIRALSRTAQNREHSFAGDWVWKYQEDHKMQETQQDASSKMI